MSQLQNPKNINHLSDIFNKASQLQNLSINPIVRCCLYSTRARQRLFSLGARASGPQKPDAGRRPAHPGASKFLLLEGFCNWLKLLLAMAKPFGCDLILPDCFSSIVLQLAPMANGFYNYDALEAVWPWLYPRAVLNHCFENSVPEGRFEFSPALQCRDLVENRCKSRRDE
jgi:hypothetical protein